MTPLPAVFKRRLTLGLRTLLATTSAGRTLLRADDAALRHAGLPSPPLEPVAIPPPEPAVDVSQPTSDSPAIVFPDPRVAARRDARRMQQQMPRRHLTWRRYLQWAVLHQEFYGPFNESDTLVIARLSWNATRLASQYHHRPPTMLVSVIMPVWNRNGIVGEAIESVLAQAYPSWELLVIDDGSTDHTIEAVRRFGDPRIRLYSTGENLGAGAARNLGLRHARGDVIAYLDSDNTWRPDFLAVMTGVLADAPVAHSAYCAQSVTEYFPGETLEGIRFAPFSRAQLENRNYIDINAFVHDRVFLERTGGFDETYTGIEDWDFVLRGTVEAPPIAVPALLSNYRYHWMADSVTMSANWAMDWQRIERLLGMRGFRLPLSGACPIPPEAEGRTFYPPAGAPPTLATRPFVTIVIPSFRAAKYLDACLQAVTACTPHGRYEVIIVDNASDAATRDVIERHLANPDIRLIANPRNFGFSHAANQGIRAARSGSHIILLNNDALVTPGWFDALQEVIESCPDAGMAVPRQVLLPGTPTSSTHVPAAHLSREIDVTLSAHHDNIVDPEFIPARGFVEVSFAPFFCVWITPECIGRAGLLDAVHGPHYGSDRLYCDTVRESAGLRVVYTPHAKVYHFLQRATAELQQDDPAHHAALFSTTHAGYELPPDAVAAPPAASTALRRPARMQAARLPVLTGLAPLDARQQLVVEAFMQLTWDLWNHGRPGGRGTLDAAWLGTRAQKCPLDLWTYQEILAETQPDLIIEMGTCHGGSALFLASMCDLLGRGRVVSIDIADVPGRPSHPRLTYVHAPSTSPATIASMTREAARAGRIMVILDSDHARDHVLAELHAYADLVTRGCYLVVEDTAINGHPFFPEHGPGPWEAVDAFIAQRPDFVVDRDRERFLMTLNPGGYLRRLSGEEEDERRGRRLGAASRARLQQLARVLIDLDGVALDDCTLFHGEPEPPSLPRRRALRIEGRDWPAHAVSMVGLVRLTQMQEAIEAVVAERVLGDVVEAGVWRGGTCILARAALRELEVTDHRVWCADSFKGLPQPEPDWYPADAGDRHHEVAYLRASLEDVRANFARFGQLDDHVRFLAGWFSDTLPEAPIEQICILRLDADLYSSTMEAMEGLYPRMSPGGFVIVDDYGAVEGCRAAVDDFRAAHGIAAPLEYIDWTGRFWRVPRRFDDEERARLHGQSALPDASSDLDFWTRHTVAGNAERIEQGRAFLAKGDVDAARATAAEVLALEPNNPPAYALLASILMPGADYLSVLRDLHVSLAPRTYVELGVFRGESLTLAQPGARVLGVDPRPVLDEPPRPGVRLFTSTSAAFFASGDSERWMGGGFDFAFIDASHAMAAVLLDFMALERFARRGSTIAIHDTFPVDERVATPVRSTTFYCGDVWKAVAALREFRPDLEVTTIACPPSGLTLVRGLQPASRVLWERYTGIVERFEALPFSWFEARRDSILNIRPARPAGYGR